MKGRHLPLLGAVERLIAFVAAEGVSR